MSTLHSNSPFQPIIVLYGLIENFPFFKRLIKRCEKNFKIFPQ